MKRLSLGLGIAVGAALLLAGCAARYPMGMSKAEWERLTPQQQHEARMKQGDINREHARRRADAAAAQRAREEAELRRVQALYDSGRWGDVIECVIEGGMADFHPGWRAYRPVPFSLARGESKRITLTENGRRTGGFYASFADHGGDLRICYRDPQHWGRFCTNILVSRRGFSDGYAGRITVRDVFRNADLYCAYRPGHGMPQVRLYRENHHVWTTLYRYHYPDAPPPSRVVYYDRRYHGRRAGPGHRDDYRRHPQPRYEERDRYTPRYGDRPRQEDVRDRRGPHGDDRDRYARERERERINPRPTTGAAAPAKEYLDRTRQRPEPPRDDRDRYARERERERINPRPTTGAAAAAKAYIDSTRRPAEPRRDEHSGRDDRRNPGAPSGGGSRVRDTDVRIGKDVQIRKDDVRVGNVRVRQDDVRIAPPPVKSPPPGQTHRGGPPQSTPAATAAVGPPARKAPPASPGHASRGPDKAVPNKAVQTGHKPPMPPGQGRAGLKPGQLEQPQLPAK